MGPVSQEEGEVCMFNGNEFTELPFSRVRAQSHLLLKRTGSRAKGLRKGGKGMSEIPLAFKERGKEGKQKDCRAIFKGSTYVQDHKFIETLMVGLCDFTPLVINLDWHK